MSSWLIFLFKFLSVNIINLEKADRPKEGVSDNVDKVILLNFVLVIECYN